MKTVRRKCNREPWQSLRLGRWTLSPPKFERLKIQTMTRRQQPLRKADPVPASSLNAIQARSGDRVRLPDLRDDLSWVAGLNIEWLSTFLT